MYICMMDRQGQVLLHRNIRNNDFGFFLKQVEPYRHDLTVTCENSALSAFWLADACKDAGTKFVLAHAFYVKSITKVGKTQRLDWGIFDLPPAEYAPQVFTQKGLMVVRLVLIQICRAVQKRGNKKKVD